MGRSAFMFRCPTRVQFARGSVARLADLVSGERVGVVSSPTVLRLPSIVSALDKARENALSLTVLGVASPNPRVSEAERAATAARSEGVTTIVGIGGGSALDCAKAVRLACSLGQPVSTLFDSAHEEADGHAGLVTVPTVFGTGAEVSAGAILTDDETKVKRGIRGPAVVPDACIIDPDLTASVPLDRTVEIGFDGLAHAIETFLSRAASPFTDALAIHVLDSLPHALLRLRRVAERDAATEVIAQASCMMGFNLANASTCLPHRMQYSVARVADSNHQRDLIALYPAWLDALERERIGRLETALLGVRSALKSLGHAPAERASDLFRQFWALLGPPFSLRDLGLGVKDVPRLVDGVEGKLDLDPLLPDRARLTEIFERAMEARPA